MSVLRSAKFGILGIQNSEVMLKSAGMNSHRRFVTDVSRMPGESYRRRLGSLLLCLCDVF